MRRQQTMVTLRVDGVSKGMLTLNRYPLPHFLRFVTVGGDWKTLDALDLLTDQPKWGEDVIVAVKSPKSEGAMHISRTPRSLSGWYRLLTYDRIEPQPDREILRSTELWQAWCLEQVQKVKVAS